MPASSKAEHVAAMLIEHVPSAQSCGASAADIMEGYRLAAERVAAWQAHQDWPLLRDGASLP